MTLAHAMLDNEKQSVKTHKKSKQNKESKKLVGQWKKCHAPRRTTPILSRKDLLQIRWRGACSKCSTPKLWLQLVSSGLWPKVV